MQYLQFYISYSTTEAAARYHFSKTARHPLSYGHTSAGYRREACQEHVESDRDASRALDTQTL